MLGQVEDEDDLVADELALDILTCIHKTRGEMDDFFTGKDGEKLGQPAVEVLHDKSLATHQLGGRMTHQVLQGAENGVDLASEVLVDSRNADAFFLDLLLLAGSDDKFQDVLSHFQRRSQMSCRFRCGCVFQ